jgi:hypothetical protein
LNKEVQNNGDVGSMHFSTINICPFDIVVEENGYNYELIPVKVQNNGDVGNMHFITINICCLII